MKSETIFLTGATGYLGNAIAIKCAETGFRVKALIRDPKKIEHTPVSFHQNPEIITVKGDLLNPETFQEELKNCSYLIHTAALVKVWTQDRSLFYKTNVDAIEKLFIAAHRYGIKKILYVSSFFALGPSTKDKPCTELTMHDSNHFHNDYEKSKYLGDQKAAELIQNGIPIIRIYPAVIYGPGMLTDGNLIAKMIIEYLHGKAMGILGGNKLWTYSYIHDITFGIIRALDKGITGERYILGGEHKKLNELYACIAQLTDRKPLTRKIPYWAASMLGLILYTRAQLFHREPLITHEVVNIFKHHWTCDCKKAISELGYTITPFETGIKLTIAWITRQTNTI